ncbi:hypothetical protein F441_02806 [Phytophthora nicotianae CJ01A1]|uniref:Uncharacterized protein n=4 Tax=Phytophthora nicotianae TaxID=4792 RepID=W2QQC1_PHYN3|nr:hypothetical protein PPTG_22126 [Phytophthora nicotianae INRA-310]ETK94200.1 hypothetical protein L915_02708 [Phytophthora nicotianae]ETO83099.1 hypothetical protein F444_02829 [Phytophthora nicotianae P1976]ETP24161.1 hypothetical protein F441_02806 [Phytophthora nicotianae CJ01A1]ETL47591.1 hypothetical protein L916_02683 [Phytophthora nicotianae]ETM00679.1 hypothetical protein L917_02622 [Phytophthora nicotianae]
MEDNGHTSESLAVITVLLPQLGSSDPEISLWESEKTMEGGTSERRNTSKPGIPVKILGHYRFCRCETKRRIESHACKYSGVTPPTSSCSSLFGTSRWL